MIVRFALAIFTAIALMASCAFAEEHTYRRTEEQMKDLLQRIHRDTDRFRNSLSDVLQKNGVNDATARDSINQFVQNLALATGRLEDRYRDNETDPAGAEQVLRWSVAIDGFLWRHRLTPRVQCDWRVVRSNLHALADAYHITWGWLGPIGDGHRRSEVEMKALINRLESRADTFRESLDDALDRSRFDGTSSEDNVNQLVKDFEYAADRLKDEFADDSTAPGAVHDVLDKAARIDAFMRQHRLTLRAQGDWHGLRDEVDRLADAYHASSAW